MGVHSHVFRTRQRHRALKVLAVISSLQVKHLESAHVERYSNEAHRRLVDMDHVLVQGLDVVVVDGDFAGFVQEREAVSVAGAEEYGVETATTTVDKFHLVKVENALNVWPDFDV